MELIEQIKKQAKELQAFAKKQTTYAKNYQNELSKNIELIKDEKQKAQVSSMLGEAIKGNLQNVLSISDQLKKGLQNAS